MAGVIAQILSEDAENQVEIVHHETSPDWAKMAEMLELDFSRVSFRYVERGEREKLSTWNPYRRLSAEFRYCREYSEPYDVFIASGKEPPVFHRAKRGILLVPFPSVTFEEFHGHTCSEWRRQSFLTRFLKSKYHALEWRCRFSSYDTWICLSEFTRRWAKVRWGISPQVLPMPLRSTLTPGEKKPLILSLGRFFAGNWKRQDVLLETFQKLYRANRKEIDGRGIRFRMMGTCSEHPDDVAFVESLRRRAGNLPVEIVVNAPGQGVREALSQALCLWHATGYGVNEYKYPERMEHFGMTAVEAMASGAVPLVYHAGGVPEVVRHNRDGFLWSSQEELVDLTRQILRDEERLRQMRQSAIHAAARYELDAFREKLKNL